MQCQNIWKNDLSYIGVRRLHICLHGVILDAKQATDHVYHLVILYSQNDRGHLAFIYQHYNKGRMTVEIKDDRCFSRLMHSFCRT